MVKIDADTKMKISDMNSALTTKKEAVINDILRQAHNITAQLHKNFQKVN